MEARTAVAVAPFTVLGDAGERELGVLSGLRSDLLSALAARSDLKVFARSFDPSRDPAFEGVVAEVAATLAEDRVHALVVVRRPGGPPRVAATEARLSSAAGVLADTLAALVGDGPLLRRRASAEDALPQDAYERLLLARHHAASFSPADADAAIALYREVLDRVPGYGPALAGLAAATFQQIRYGALDAAHYESVRAWADAAAEGDPDLAEAHVVRALVALYHDRDLRAAAAAFGDALALDRDHVDVLKEYAWLLSAVGEDDRAIAALDRALEYDPLSVDLLCTRADLARMAERYAEAQRYYRQAHALDLRYARAIEGVASTASALGDRDEAYRHLDLYRRHAPSRHWRHRTTAEIAARFGDHALHAEALDALLDFAREHPEADLSADLASALAATDPDRAMGHLADAYHRGVGVVSVLRYPVFAPLRDRDDYRALVADLDLGVDVPSAALTRTRRVTIGEGSDAVAVPLADLVYVAADGNYATVVRARGTDLRSDLVRTPLAAVERAAEGTGLVRVHHSFLANLDRPGWRLDGNARTAALRLDALDVAVPVSRSRFAALRQRFG